MAVAGKPLEFVRGSSQTIEVLIKNKKTGLPFDLTDGKIIFTLKRSLESSTEQARKTSDTASEAILLTQSGDTLGKAHIFITPSDTTGATIARDYVYDVWFELVSGERYPVIKPSQWDMQRAATEDFT